MEAARIWFITGCATGFGRALAAAALARGDKVAVTDRDRAAVAEWEERYPDTALALQLDVTRQDEIMAALDTAFERFGRIDLLVNNAGYGLQGATEEASEAEIRRLFDINLFGMIAIIRAALPRLRAQGAARIFNFASVGGRVSGPLLALYAASKFAVEGLSLGLAQELADFGITVTAIEPGAFATRFGASAAAPAHQIDAYAPLRDGMAAMLDQLPQGEPETLAEAVLTLADTEQPPLQFIGGGDAYAMIEQELERQQTEMRVWRPLSEAANSRAQRRTSAG